MGVGATTGGCSPGGVARPEVGESGVALIELERERGLDRDRSEFARDLG